MSDPTYVPVKNVDRLFVDTGVCNLVVLHSMECPMADRNVANWVSYLHGDPWPFFAQEYYGPTLGFRVAPLDTKVAHCGNGNTYLGHRSVGREHAGYAAQPTSLWLSPAGRSMLEASAAQTRKDCLRWGIPMEFLSVADLKAGRRGITSHNNCSLALHGSTHTDPGSNFPYDAYIALVRNNPAPPDPLPPEVDVDKMVTCPNADGRMQVFWIDTADGNKLKTVWQTFDGKWSGTAGLGGNYGWSELSTARLSTGTAGAAGRIEVYGLNGYGQPAVIAQTAPNGSWSGVVPLGG